MQCFKLGGPDGHTLELTTFEEWSRLFPEQVAYNEVGDKHVSTIFLGYDMGPGPQFETMAFDGENALGQERCKTWDEAMAQHDAMLARVRAA